MRSDISWTAMTPPNRRSTPTSSSAGASASIGSPLRHGIWGRSEVLALALHNNRGETGSRDAKQPCEATGSHEHHADEHHAIEEHAIIVERAHVFREKHDYECAEDRTLKARTPADHHHDQDFHRLQEPEVVWIEVAGLVRVKRAGDARHEGRNHEGLALVAREGDAARLCRFIVLLHCQQGAPEARVVQSRHRRRHYGEDAEVKVKCCHWALEREAE